MGVRTKEAGREGHRFVSQLNKYQQRSRDSRGKRERESAVSWRGGGRDTSDMAEARDDSGTQPNADDASREKYRRNERNDAEDQIAVRDVPEGDRNDSEDRRRNQHSHDKVEAGEPSTMVTPDPENKKIDTVPGERQKLDRRKRRCPVVNVHRYPNSSEDDGEGKEDEESGKRRSFARVVMQEDVTGFSRLVQEGIGILDSDGHGWSALHWASSRGSTVLTCGILQEIKLLQEADSSAGEGTDGASDAVVGFLDLREKLGGWTALHLAAIGGHLDVVYMLMEAGCDPRVKDKVGDQPIHCIRRKRTSKGLVKRLRNALLDLSDTEESSCEESMEPLPRRGPIRERHRHR